MFTISLSPKEKDPSVVAGPPGLTLVAYAPPSKLMLLSFCPLMLMSRHTTTFPSKDVFCLMTVYGPLSFEDSLDHWLLVFVGEVHDMDSQQLVTDPQATNQLPSSTLVTNVLQSSGIRSSFTPLPCQTQVLSSLYPPSPSQTLQLPFPPSWDLSCGGCEPWAASFPAGLPPAP